MARYCTSCGAELEPEVQFCGECGAEIDPEEPADTEGESDPSVETTVDESDSSRQYLPESWRVGFAGAFFGIIVGGLVAWALANIGGSGIGFFVAFVGVTLYLWRKETATGAIGSGLYISALVLILVPILFYSPNLASSEDPQTAEQAGMVIGSALGLVIWGFVFALVALVVGAIGYFFKRRERKILSS
jgi:hypothetical protein